MKIVYTVIVTIVVTNHSTKNEQVTKSSTDLRTEVYVDRYTYLQRQNGCC